jgi:hypothetical protein
MFAEGANPTGRAPAAEAAAARRRSDMVNARVCATVLMVVALVAWSGVAQAGGGGAGGGTDAVGSLCYLINGAQQDRVLNLADQFGERTNVRLGKGQLLCTTVTITLVGSEFDAAFGGDHAKCYELQGESSGKPTGDAQLTDPFDVETVKVHGPKYLCIEAFKEFPAP